MNIIDSAGPTGCIVSGELFDVDPKLRDMLYELFCGTNSYSELNAIIQYSLQCIWQPTPVAERLYVLRTARFNRLGQIISAWGGSPDLYFSTTYTDVGADREDCMRIAVETEILTLERYRELENHLAGVPDGYDYLKNTVDEFIDELESVAAILKDEIERYREKMA